MRILMLDNSFTFANDMPSILAELTGAEVVQHTRGGARLAEHLNPSTKLGAKTLAALENETWDYVILQEMSNAPVTSRKAFLRSVLSLCNKIHENGSTPLLYATWAYKKGSVKMTSMPLSYDEMASQMYEAYHEAADQNNALVADVGQRFYELSETMDLYAEDGCHPNEAGSRLAAELFADVIIEDQKRVTEQQLFSNHNGAAIEQIKVIFLDIDGVLNDVRTKSRTTMGFQFVDTSKILRLKRLWRRLGLKSYSLRTGCKNRRDLAICTEISCHCTGENLPPYRNTRHH